jgi:hypothetical protein
MGDRTPTIIFGVLLIFVVAAFFSYPFWVNESYSWIPYGHYTAVGNVTAIEVGQQYGFTLTVQTPNGTFMGTFQPELSSLIHLGDSVNVTIDTYRGNPSSLSSFTVVKP